MLVRKSLWKVGLVGAVAVVVTACSHEDAATVLSARGPVDLRCAATQVQWRTIAPHTYSAKGCGAEAIYTCSLNQYSRYSSDWSCVLESNRGLDGPGKDVHL